jgi:DNA-binding Xre family transcriptional regulator
MPALKVRLKELMREKAIRDGRDIEHNALTQQEVADAAGISRATLSNWAREKVDCLDKTMIAKLCRYFDCGIEDLLHIVD